MDGKADDPQAQISRYAEQPADLREGLGSAYKSLSGNLRSAAQTILAVPMEVYERAGTEVSGASCSATNAVPETRLISNISSKGPCPGRGEGSAHCRTQANDRRKRSGGQGAFRAAEHHGAYWVHGSGG